MANTVKHHFTKSLPMLQLMLGIPTEQLLYDVKTTYVWFTDLQYKIATL